MSDVPTVLDALRRLRQAKVDTITALENMIEGLDIAIQLLSDEAEPTTQRISLTETILDILAGAGEELQPKQVIAAAAERGIDVNRGSLYVMLNRMEKLGKLTHGEKGYTIKPMP